MVHRSIWRWSAVLAPLLLVSYLVFKTTVGRLDDANRHLGEVNSLYLSTIETLAMAIDAKDQVTHGHIRRVQKFAVGLAKLLGVDDDKQLRAIEAAALLHDMGKLAIPEFILNKPGRLTDSEFDVMKTHAAVGADILSCDQFPLSSSSDRSTPPRELGRQRLPRRHSGRHDTNRRSHSVGRRLLRCANVRSPLSPCDVRRASDSNTRAAKRLDVRPTSRRHICPRIRFAKNRGGTGYGSTTGACRQSREVDRFPSSSGRRQRPRRVAGLPSPTRDDLARG